MGRERPSPPTGGDSCIVLVGVRVGLFYWPSTGRRAHSVSVLGWFVMGEDFQAALRLEAEDIDPDADEFMQALITDAFDTAAALGRVRWL